MGGTRGARCPPPVPPRPPAWLLLTFSRLRREGRTRKPEERSSRRLTLPPRRSCGAQSATSARTSGGGAPCRAGGLHARVLQRLRTRRGAELHLYCHTRGTAPPPSHPPFPSASSQPAPSRLQLQQGGGQLAVAAFQVLQRLEKPAELEGQQGSWGGGARGSETFGGGERAPSTALLVGTGRWGSLPLFSFLPLPSPQPRGPF